MTIVFLNIPRLRLERPTVLFNRFQQIYVGFLKIKPLLYGSCFTPYTPKVHTNLHPTDQTNYSYPGASSKWLARRKGARMRCRRCQDVGGWHSAVLDANQLRAVKFCCPNRNQHVIPPRFSHASPNKKSQPSSSSFYFFYYSYITRSSLGTV